VNRILVVDDEAAIVEEYLRCLGEGRAPSASSKSASDLEDALFGQKVKVEGSAHFSVDSQRQGADAVAAVAEAMRIGRPYSVIFLDLRMPPGIDGKDAAARIRAIDPWVNIVIVTGTFSPEADNLGAMIPPADRIFFFQKPFHAAECRQLASALCGKWNADVALRQANEVLEQRVLERTSELHKLAFFDPVTKLPNRLKLVDDLKQLIDRADSAVERIAVVLLDLDRFSFLNETMGYRSGTKLLVSLAHRFSRMLNDSQQCRNAVVGRFGSDEYAILIPDIANEAALEQSVELVKQTVEDPFLLDGRELFLKASIGVACYPTHARGSADLISCAEAALHRSKRLSAGKVIHYQSEMRNLALHRFDLEADLRGALEAGDIVVHFQPQKCLKTGVIGGVEALARWNRPDGTIVPACDFIAVAEDVIGISNILFETMLRQVCDAISRWRAVGPWTVPIAVNMSAHQLCNDNLVALIKSILDQYSVAPELINLELTETVLLEDFATATRVLADLSSCGVGIHIDDFGIGYSSMSYLAELPVQALKIDVAFVKRMTESETNARIVQAITALGKALNLEVIAEGVETGKQFQILKEYGCNLAQGYFVGKPMPESDFRRWCEMNQDE
jgi:diguanylate cyclase (GGDEF)-like protein